VICSLTPDAPSVIRRSSSCDPNTYRRRHRDKRREDWRVNVTVEKEERRGEDVWGAIIRIQKP
jgi:hypothetical protein